MLLNQTRCLVMKNYRQILFRKSVKKHYSLYAIFFCCMVLGFVFSSPVLAELANLSPLTRGQVAGASAENAKQNLPIAKSTQSVKDKENLRYLIFQTTVTPRGSEAYREYKKEVDRIISEVRSQEVAQTRQLGFGIVIAPFMLPEREISQIVGAAFKLALENDLALQVAFESHYYWFGRPDLWNWFDPKKPGYNPDNKNNVEWTDWEGTPVKGRYLDWGSPVTLPPHMCYNSKKLQKDIRRLILEVLGPAVQKGVQQLKSAGKAHLFSGITVTSEPSLDDYSVVDKINPRLAGYMEKIGAAKVALGYCALTNNGYSRRNPPKDFRRALAEINRDWVASWAKNFTEAGFDRSKLFNHVSAAAGLENAMDLTSNALIQFTNAPLWIAFNPYSTPGFTTYPTGPLKKDFQAIYKELKEQNVTRWGGVEANILSTGVPWEEYLQRHFDHGAVMINVMDYFHEGAGGPNKSKEQGPAGTSARAAFKTFLKGEKLSASIKERQKVNSEKTRPTRAERPDVITGSIEERIQKKMLYFQQGLEPWVERGNNPSEQISPKIKEFEQLLKSGQPQKAESILDELLAIVEAR